MRKRDVSNIERHASEIDKERWLHNWLTQVYHEAQDLGHVDQIWVIYVQICKGVFGVAEVVVVVFGCIKL